LAWADEIIADLHALYDSEMITENDSGDALIRLDAAICAVEEAEERRTAGAVDTQPAQPAQRQPLTDEQRRNIVRANKMCHDSDEIDPYGVIDDVEAAHGIGEKT
jgi:hypothetical protein